jgi:hypothetical protein
MKFKDLVESKQSCPHCGGPMFSEMLMMEKKDACYYKVKASAKVWPSAYASGRLVQCRKKGAGNYGNKSEGVAEGNLKEFAPGAGGGDAGNYFQTLASAWYNGTFDTGSLQKGIKSKEDIERLLQRGIVCPDGVTRKFGIDYNSDFDGVVISSDDYYEHADHDETDSRTGKPFGPYDYMEFGDDDLDESAKWRDPKYKGQLYTQEKPDYNDSREYDRARWDPKPKGYKGRKEPMAGGEFPRTDPLVRGAGIGRTGIKHNINLSGKRKGLPSRDQITSLKQSIRDIHGQHTRANLPEQGVAEGSQQVDSLVTDALKIMRGSEASDAVAALKTVLGDREYNSRRNYYNFYVRQLMDMSGQQGMAEDRNPEYDDEAGMADNNLETLDRAVEGIDRLIDSGDNLPEWCQEKIAVAKSMLVSVWDYMYSEEASDEVDPEVDEMFEAMDQLAEEMAVKNGVSADLVWEQFEALPDNVLYETAAWRRKEGKSKKGGLNAKGVASYRRENPGSKLQMAVTTKPSKLKKGSKAAKRRKSFCARMSGVKGPMKKPNGKPTRKALALRKWNC